MIETAQEQIVARIDRTPAWPGRLLISLFVAAALTCPTPAAPQVSGDPVRERTPIACEFPIGWRIVEIDPRFELSRDDAQFAMERAAAFWEGAVGRPLFAYAPEGELPIRFQFDQRQADLMVRSQILEDLARIDAELEVRRQSIAAADRRFVEDQAEYLERAEEVQRNTRPLEAEIEYIRRRGEELREIHERTQTLREQLNRDIDERNRLADSTRSRGSVRASESGRYVEEVRSQAGRIISLQGEVRIFRYANQDELVLVIAHELGHALGLGHSTEPGAIMNEVLPGTASRVEARLSASNMAVLRNRCSGL